MQGDNIMKMLNVEEEYRVATAATDLDQTLDRLLRFMTTILTSQPDFIGIRSSNM